MKFKEDAKEWAYAVVCTVGLMLAGLLVVAIATAAIIGFAAGIVWLFS